MHRAGRSGCGDDVNTVRDGAKSVHHLVCMLAARRLLEYAV